MLFKRFFYSTLGGTIFSAFFGIALAYAGFGVWAIVAQQLSNTAIDTLILWLTVKWRPKKMFSWERLKGLLSFGWKMLTSSLLDTVYNNIRSLIIGKMYSSSDLAFYDQGKKFPNVIVTNINTSIDSVLLPTMSNAQDDASRVKSMTRRAIKTSTYIMAPLMMGLAFCATPVVRLVLTDKWLPCVPFLRIFCITYIAEMSVEAAMGTAIKGNIHEPKGFYATHNLHSNKNGTYKDIVFSPEIEPYIYRKCLYKKVGDAVEYFDNAAKCLGIVFFKFPDENVMRNVLGHINDLITIELQ